MYASAMYRLDLQTINIRGMEGEQRCPLDFKQAFF